MLYNPAAHAASIIAEGSRQGVTIVIEDGHMKILSGNSTPGLVWKVDCWNRFVREGK